MILIFLMLISTEVAVESGIVENRTPQMHPLEESLDKKQAEIAIQIETVLIDKGIKPRLARAATVNAIAESNLDPNIIGDSGNSVGVFQLNKHGMGKNMTVSSRKDIKISAEKVANAMLKDRFMMTLQEKCAPIEEMIRHFTLRIMRPRDKEIKSKQRVLLGKKVLHTAMKVDCSTT